MGKERLAAFSDGVFAILLTILVLDLKIPSSDTLSALAEIMPVFLSYVLSFIYLAIYWNNHHHLLHLLKSLDGRVMWANMHLLFWLSLLPFTTAWMGRYPSSSLPTALYGASLFLPALAYFLLQKAIIHSQNKQGSDGSLLARALGRDIKGKLSPVLYGTAIMLAFIAPWAAQIFFVAVALMWLCPDQRIEKVVGTGE